MHLNTIKIMKKWYNCSYIWHHSYDEWPLVTKYIRHRISTQKITITTLPFMQVTSDPHFPLILIQLPTWAPATKYTRRWRRVILSGPWLTWPALLVVKQKLTLSALRVKHIHHTNASDSNRNKSAPTNGEIKIYG